MSGAYCRFRKDTATSLKFKGVTNVYSETAGTYDIILEPASGKAMIIDSIYVRSDETSTTAGPLQVEFEILSTTGGGSSRTFFVALMDPAETCLAASKSTPVMIDNGQYLRMKAAIKNAGGVHTANAFAYVSYREYDVS